MWVVDGSISHELIFWVVFVAALTFHTTGSRHPFLQNLHSRLKIRRRVSCHRMRRTAQTCDALVMNPCVLVGPLFHVDRTSCPTVVPYVRDIDGDLYGRQGFGFD